MVLQRMSLAWFLIRKGFEVFMRALFTCTWLSTAFSSCISNEIPTPYIFVLSLKSTCDDFDAVIRDDLSMFYVSPSKLHPLSMYESIELLFPQSLEGTSNSRHVSAGEEVSRCNVSSH